MPDSYSWIKKGGMENQEQESTCTIYCIKQEESVYVCKWEQESDTLHTHQFNLKKKKKVKRKPSIHWNGVILLLVDMGFQTWQQIHSWMDSCSCIPVLDPNFLPVLCDMVVHLHPAGSYMISLLTGDRSQQSLMIHTSGTRGGAHTHIRTG